ncbi:hypothetical protein CY35_17G041300 [Sphagnum magellanicum]|nr:hypothetical protein CY35_17G041300 [Sphagnum magellanicum]
MAQRSSPLRVSVPLPVPDALGPSSSRTSRRRQGSVAAFTTSPIATPISRQRPAQEWPLWISTCLHLLSLYAVQQWLQEMARRQAGLVIFAAGAFLGSALLFLLLIHRPWRGRPLSSAQVALSFGNAGLLVLCFLLRLQGLRSCGRLETILAEYAGVVAAKGLLNLFLLQKARFSSAKFGGLVAISIGLILLSQGWAEAACSPVSFKTGFRLRSLRARLKQQQQHGNLGVAKEDSGGLIVVDAKDCGRALAMLSPVLAGVLSAFHKLIASQTVLKTIPKKRQCALSFAFGTLLLLPVAVVLLSFDSYPGQQQLGRSALWPLLSTILFGMVGAFVGETYTEEKLQVSTYSRSHFVVIMCVLCVLELLYGSKVSLPGFLFCGLLLGIGISHVEVSSGGLSWEAIVDQQSSSGVPSFTSIIKTSLLFIVADAKTRKIGMFLLLSTAFMVVEFMYGFHSNSLGLISDACHMLFDCAALAIGLYASYVAKLKANFKFNYGYGRFEIISGYANAIFLILVASLIVLESLERILDPPEISTESLLMVSVGGFLVNVIGLIFFHEAHHHHGGPCPHFHASDHEHKPLLHGVESSRDPAHSQDGTVLKVAEEHDHHHHHHHHGNNQTDIQGLHHRGHDHDVGHTDHCEELGKLQSGDQVHLLQYDKHRQDYWHEQQDLHKDRPGNDRELHHHHHHSQHDHNGNTCNHDNNCRHIHDHSHGHSQEDSQGQELFHSHEHEQQHHHGHMDHNMQGIFLHVLADTLGSVGVVVSTLLIKYKGWLFTDPACSIFISALIIASVVPLVRNSSEILLQRVPRAVEVHLKQSMKEVEAVEGIQHCQNLHIWSFTNTEIVGSLHLHVVAGTDKQWVCNKVAQILKKAGIKDLTLQIENVQSLVK